VRLQISPSFDLYAAADACDALATLGAGALYLSPLLPSVRGSAHGYDVVGYDGIDAARGGLDGWTRLLAAARARGLRVVLDIVPNHSGVADPAQHPAWWDVLATGCASAFAPWFDIDWSAGRLVLPVLADDAAIAELTLDGDELHYRELRFPLAPGTGPRPGEGPADVHDRQHYRLVAAERADADVTYRRFFAVSTLAGLNVEDPEVFDATHPQIARWMAADGVEGLRVDHPDGLAAPGGYLDRLRALTGPDAWLIVEKILQPGETLPAQWPVDGTTGYDALDVVSAVFVDDTAATWLDSLYRELTGDEDNFAAHARTGRREVATTLLRAEFGRLARLAPAVPHAAHALAELAAAFDVYRTYLPSGADHLHRAADQVRADRPELAAALGTLLPRLSDPEDELCRRFQQSTAAVVAKGVEDTALYRYTRFVARNEVGGNPAVIGMSPAQWHDAQLRRQAHSAVSMTTLATHDTKRGEDVRARLAVLAELPDEWPATARALMSAAPVPDRAFGYLLWQTFAGTGFIARDRMHGYAEKAMREAARSTTWTTPDVAFEAAVHRAVDAGYDDPTVRGLLTGLIERLTPHGWSNSLAQKLVQLTMPGVPDVYQGTWSWDDSLVDPDNRRPVDLAQLREQLDCLDADVDPPPIDASGLAKLWVVSRTLRLRRDWPDLFTGYQPVHVEGPAAEHAIAYDRGGAITVATRLPVRLARHGGWHDTELPAVGAATDVISGRTFSGPIALADLLADYPVALLVP
jgi:(1->4)-alpha-D-glucan 1-alpha-D-glucosylmutase